MCKAMEYPSIVQLDLFESGCQLVQNAQRFAFLYVNRGSRRNALTNLLTTHFALYRSFDDSVLSRECKYYISVAMNGRTLYQEVQ